MNREILFRALKDDMSNCVMVYGHLVYHFDVPRITADCGETFTTCLKGTVGQFTGRLDEDGNKIFEGDIIPIEVGVDKWNEHFIRNEVGIINGVVEWDEKPCKYIVKYKESKKHNIISSEFGWGGQKFKVIGNIHQNPEFLES